MNQDHLPYVCISQDCSGSLPRFAGSAEWFQHMVSNHEENWHQQVHAPWSWACPLCTGKEAIFPHASKLTAHLESIHAGDLTESQARAIVGQSQFQFPRPRHICPLCCFSVADQQCHTLQTHDNGDVSMHNGDQPATGTLLESRVDARLSSTKPAHVETIGTHVAAHLQFLMLLTLRLISIDDLAGTSAGNQSLSSNPDDRSSDLGPDIDPDVQSGSDNARSESAMFELDFERQSGSEMEDFEEIDWAYILGPHAPDERSGENTGMDVDVSDTKGEPAIDANSPGDSTSKVSDLSMIKLISIHSVLGFLPPGNHSGGGLVRPAEQDIRNLCTEARRIFLSQPMLLDLVGPLQVYRSLSDPVRALVKLTLIGRWRYSWTLRRPVATVPNPRLPSRDKLHLSWQLC
jgi:hypothetical protein